MSAQGSQPSQLPRSAPELVVVLKPGSPVHRTLTEGPATAAAAAASQSVLDIQSILAKSGAAMHPMFAAPEGNPSIQSEMTATRGSGGDDLSRYFHIAAPESQLDGLANELRTHPSVDAAYVKPPAEPPVMAISRSRTMHIGLSVPPSHAPAAASPDWTHGQIYLDAAPAGVDARFAWTKPGGLGEGVQIIDCEWNWNLQHEDLRLNKRGVLVGSAGGDDDHGTAVWGEIGGDRNLFGVTGIAAKASLGAASFANSPTAQVIMGAANNLRAGDIVLLEIHRSGPAGNGQGQFGYIGVEWWPDDLAAIRYAVARGIIVVEAAGNGSQNLDDPIYNARPADFPATWTNPFNPANPTSGAVLVGAGNPPKGTHGRDEHPSWKEPYVDRARCGFSNYGRRIDCQGWGWEVTSTGYGDLPNGGERNKWYTNEFSGTSSASPIITGTLACLQGIQKAAGRPLLTPAQAIKLLRTSGSPQQDAPSRPASQRIGNRPDLKRLIAAVEAVA
jgi:hypothetical protein